MTDAPLQQPDYPDFLEECSAKIAALLVDRGVDTALAQDVVRDFADYVRSPEGWGGQQIYIQKGRTLNLAERDCEIEAMWTGPNLLDVCRRYGLTGVQVRRIAERVRRSRRGGSDNS